jgi:simple sugar transport system permease protein
VQASVDQELSLTPLQRVRQSTSYGMVRRLVIAPEFGAGVAAVLLYVIFVCLSLGNGFVTATGTASWLNTASELGIIAVPVGLLMISGNFDLSIGSMVGAGAIIVGIGMDHFNASLLASAGVAAAFAVLVGLGNGLLVTRTGLPSFIVTLAASLIVAGLALTISLDLTHATVLTISASGPSAKVFSATWRQFNVSILWWLAILAAGIWVLGQTRFGNWIFATGGDKSKARRTGVLTSRVTITLYVCSALAATLVGVLQAVVYNTADATSGQGYVFEAPIVVVIGGVLLTGGYGSMVGVAIGTLIYGVVSAGFFYTGWNTDWAQVVIGALMVVAVTTNNFIRRLALKTGREKE